MKRSISPTLVSSVVTISVVAIIGLSYLFWDELKGTDSAGAAIRNIGLVGGSIIAIALALWRSSIAQRQVEVAEQDSLDGQFQKAAAMLGHEDEFVRLGGVITLNYLGRNHLDRYGFQVCAVLDQFSLLKRNQTVASNRQTGIERVRPGRKGTLKYKGPPDGAQAFNAFWDLQEQLSQYQRDRNSLRRVQRRLVQRARSSLGRLFSRTDGRH